MKNVTFIRRYSKRKQSGQSVIEFILVSFIFLSFFFMYMKMCMGFAVAHFFNYATFMAARSYFSGGYSESTQKQAGEAALRSYLGEDGGRFKGLVEPVDGAGTVGRGPQYNEGQYYETYWQQGATYKFKMRLPLVPLVSALRGAGNAPIELESESWLNREVSYDECVRYLTEGGNRRPWLYDNGC